MSGQDDAAQPPVADGRQARRTGISGGCESHFVYVPAWSRPAVVAWPHHGGMAGFRTLRERMGGPPDPNEVLPLNILPYMRQPLMSWVEDSCPQYGLNEAWTLLAQMLKIDYTNRQPYSAIVAALNQDNDLLLDLVDARLKLTSAHRDNNRLRTILTIAGSGWTVNAAGDALEQVVDETVRQAAQEAVDKAEASAGQHLKLAWAATHSRDRNPTLAHAEMIRAVESAARPVLTPKDLKATLGTLIGQLHGQASLYTTAGASKGNDGVAALVSMMQMLWQQQTDRHGANPTIPASQERVEFLLPVAAAVVHAFSTGAVRRVQPQMS
jgi:hypothetical protein